MGGRAVLIALVTAVTLQGFATPAVAADRAERFDRAPGDAVLAKSAYVRNGLRWPGGRIRYHVVAKQHRAAVRAGARAWNRSGARVRFVETSRRRAHVQVRYFRGRAAGGTCGHGLAIVQSAGRYLRGFVLMPRLARTGPFARFACTQVATHELGHVLGLDHEPRRCATMNALFVNLSPQRCPRNRAWEWRCRLLERDDVRGAVGLYGGRAKRVGRRQMCDLYPPVPVEDLTVQHSFDGETAGNTTVVRWRRPAAAAPDWLVRGLGMLGWDHESYDLAATRDRCPQLRKAYRRGYTSAPGELEQDSLMLGPAPGRFCVAVRTVDKLGRPGRTTTIWHDHPGDGYSDPAAGADEPGYDEAW